MSDRPLECFGCKKPIHIVYKEIDQQLLTCTHMCEECPILQQKLYGQGDLSEPLKWAEKGLCCVKCGTSTESLSLTATLGCCECYDVFEKLVIEKMLSEGLIPSKVKASYKKNSSISFHVGYTPHKKPSKKLSNAVIDLNDALKEALQKENYEKAALLRDQINQLMDKSDEEPSSS